MFKTNLMLTATLLTNTIVEVLELRVNHFTGSYEQNTINFFHKLCVFISGEYGEGWCSEFSAKKSKAIVKETLTVSIFTPLGVGCCCKRGGGM